MTLMHARLAGVSMACLLSVLPFTNARAAAPPTITTQPHDLTVTEIDPVVFSVAADGTGTLSYRWQTSSDGTTWTDVVSNCDTVSAACHLPPFISGGTSPTLTIQEWGLSRSPARFRVVVTNADGSTTSNPAVLTVLPAVHLNRSRLRFNVAALAPNNGSLVVTPPQQVTVAIPGTSLASGWTAQDQFALSNPWLHIDGGSGTGTGRFTVSVDPTKAPIKASAYGAVLTISSPAGRFAAVNLFVELNVFGGAFLTPPFGAFDTPAGDTTPLAGSIPVTGWTLDDIGVDRVEIWRDLAPGETTPPFASTPTDPRNGKIFIANATFVDDARPDVETRAPSSPLNYRGGWGYLLLTWGLPYQGNGFYRLHAFAFDVDGKVTTIGSKTIFVNNSAGAAPFGSIDTPAIGGDPGTQPNFGWALTPTVSGAATCRIPPNGVQVSIDSGPLQPVVYGDARTDIAAAFPGFSNATAAGGHFIFDWTTLSPGAHTIGWLVTDDCGRADGIGSRFFTVTGGTAATTPAPAAVRPLRESAQFITVARGYGELPQVLVPGLAGSRTVEVRQGERIELRMPRGFDAAYQLVEGQHRALPTGASWDAASGIFAWQPAPGFLGRYRIVFTDGKEAINLRVVVVP